MGEIARQYDEVAETGELAAGLIKDAGEEYSQLASDAILVERVATMAAEGLEDLCEEDGFGSIMRLMGENGASAMLEKMSEVLGSDGIGDTELAEQALDLALDFHIDPMPLFREQLKEAHTAIAAQLVKLRTIGMLASVHSEVLIEGHNGKAPLAERVRMLTEIARDKARNT